MWDLIVSVPDHCLSFLLWMCLFSQIRYFDTADKCQKHSDQFL